MNRSSHFKGISTGVTDIDGDVIHEGDWLVPGKPKPLTGHAPRRWRDFPVGLVFDYRVIYHDGTFLLKRGGKKGKKRWRLNSLTVRLNGLKIQKEMKHLLPPPPHPDGPRRERRAVLQPNTFDFWKLPDTSSYVQGYVSYTMMRAFHRGFVTQDELLEEAWRAGDMKIFLEKTQPSRPTAVRDNTELQSLNLTPNANENVVPAYPTGERHRNL